jgi:hypothetical protein
MSIPNLRATLERNHSFVPLNSVCFLISPAPIGADPSALLPFLPSLLLEMSFQRAEAQPSTAEKLASVHTAANKLRH